MLTAVYTGQGDIQFTSLGSLDQLIQCGACLQLVHIQSGMTAEKLPVLGDIQFDIPAVKDRAQAFLDGPDFIAGRVQIQEFALLSVGKVIDFGKILKDRFLQKPFYLSAVQTAFVQICPDFSVFRTFLQISYNLRYTFQLCDLFKFTSFRLPF